MSTERRRRCAGFSLIETVVFIVIVGVALAGVVSVLDLTSSRSADPMQAKQAIAVGEAFIDEILSREYTDNPAHVGNTGPRSAFDDIGDYNGYASTGIRTRSDASVDGLTQYSVLVSVAAQANVTSAGSVSVPMRQITVTVTDPRGKTYPFTAYKSALAPAP